jgi:hypothetical protein
MVNRSEPVLIVGGGAFGLSTAYHLHARNYTDITVFEQDSHIPSKYSAANDLNKIMRVEYEDPWYTDLAIVSLLVPLSHNHSHPQIPPMFRGAPLTDLKPSSCAESLTGMEDKTGFCALFSPSRLPALRVWLVSEACDRYAETFPRSRDKR